MPNVNRKLNNKYRCPFSVKWPSSMLKTVPNLWEHSDELSFEHLFLDLVFSGSTKVSGGDNQAAPDYKIHLLNPERDSLDTFLPPVLSQLRHSEEVNQNKKENKFHMFS